MARKKTLQVEEKEMTEAAMVNTVDEGETVVIEDYFPKMDQTVIPYGEYDAILYKMVDKPSYSIGSIAARSRDSLKVNGKLYLDWTGFADDVDRIIAVVEYIGLTLIEQREEDALYVFQKQELPEEEEITDDD